ncbi:hypothetical protein [Stenotrophomonas sp.]|uniref:hypothetical protein n=1 Tax=Stenotrophomonas sp. TaxID=69392 RepID=UPI002897AF7B|nr:hypothetical protein [Stenotrophomonas sp.]
MLLLSSAIPYRADPAIGAGQVLGVVMATVGLLVVAFIILLQLRRRGWLDAWTASAGSTGKALVSARWQVSSQRISRRTMVHTMMREGQTVLVVESAAGVSVTRLDVVEAKSQIDRGETAP